MSYTAKIRKHVEEFGALGFLGIMLYRYCKFPKVLHASPSKLPHIVRLRHGTTDTLTYADIIIREDYRFGLPSSAKVIVDAGANIGMVSVYYAARFPDAKIFALEAEESNFELLRKNVRAYPNIVPIHAALWKSEGFISVTNSPYEEATHWGFTVNGSPGDVRAITIPSLLSEFKLDHIDLLKVNIEASEKEVFEACNWQDRVGSVVIELHDCFKPGCSQAVNNTLKDFSQSSWEYLTWYRRSNNANNAESS